MEKAWEAETNPKSEEKMYNEKEKAEFDEFRRKVSKVQTKCFCKVIRATLNKGSCVKVTKKDIQLFNACISIFDNLINSVDLGVKIKEDDDIFANFARETIDIFKHYFK